MKCLSVSPFCLLLLWTLTVFVSCKEAEKSAIKVVELSDGLKVSCAGDYNVTYKDRHEKVVTLHYKDDNSGEYSCQKDDDSKEHIMVKFRTCDNCIDLDVGSVVGIVVGDVVATLVIGVAVYLLTAALREDPVMNTKKRSDRQLLVPPEAKGPSSDPYQPLRYKAPKDTYDKLNTR